LLFIFGLRCKLKLNPNSLISFPYIYFKISYAISFIIAKGGFIPYIYEKQHLYRKAIEIIDSAIENEKSESEIKYWIKHKERINEKI